jgi:hypothetical protein
VGVSLGRILFLSLVIIVLDRFVIVDSDFNIVDHCHLSRVIRLFRLTSLHLIIASTFGPDWPLAICLHRLGQLLPLDSSPI